MVGEGDGLAGATAADAAGAADEMAVLDAAPADAADVATVASSCNASDDPAVVDEHPDTPAVTSASPITSAFN